MTHFKKIMAVMLAFVAIMSFIPAKVFAAGAPYKGWYNAGTKANPVWRYYDRGVCLKSRWVKDGGKWYFVDNKGTMVSNTSGVIDGKVYLFGQSGAMVTKTGWSSIRFKGAYENQYKTVWFYIKSGGVCTTGWKKISGKWYYFAPVKRAAGDYYYRFYGMSVDGVAPISGTIYAFGNDGALVSKTGWFSKKSGEYTDWYYVKKGGIAVTGWKKISGKWYYFDMYGLMLYSTNVMLDGKVYKFDKNGVCLNP